MTPAQLRILRDRGLADMFHVLPVAGPDLDVLVVEGPCAVRLAKLHEDTRLLISKDGRLHVSQVVAIPIAPGETVDPGDGLMPDGAIVSCGSDVPDVRRPVGTSTNGSQSTTENTEHTEIEP